MALEVVFNVLPDWLPEWLQKDAGNNEFNPVVPDVH